MWTAEHALDDLWQTLDLQQPHGQIRITLKVALQRAYDAGRRDELNQDMDTLDRFIQPTRKNID
jgi:hypothetical protein